MKRDMELVRKILQYAVEQRIPPSGEPVSLLEYDVRTLNLYVQMLNEAGFIDAPDSIPVRIVPADNPSSQTPPDLRVNINRITWKGYELLESLS